MLNTKFDLNVLAIKAKKRKQSVLRYLFDNHIYKHVSKESFAASSKGYNNRMVQIADYGLDHINVRIKTEGVREKIG